MEGGRGAHIEVQLVRLLINLKRLWFNAFQNYSFIEQYHVWESGMSSVDHQRPPVGAPVVGVVTGVVVGVVAGVVVGVVA